LGPVVNTVVFVYSAFTGYSAGHSVVRAARGERSSYHEIIIVIGLVPPQASPVSAVPLLGSNTGFLHPLRFRITAIGLAGLEYRARHVVADQLGQVGGALQQAVEIDAVV